MTTIIEALAVDSFNINGTQIDVVCNSVITDTNSKHFSITVCQWDGERVVRCVGREFSNGRDAAMRYIEAVTHLHQAETGQIIIL